jgi:hypothetical protein
MREHVLLKDIDNNAKKEMEINLSENKWEIH